MINKIMNKKYGPLCFSLAAGLAYFMVILKFIIHFTYSQQGWLLGFFFAPAVICGSALLLLKALRQFSEAGNLRAVRFLFIMHIVLFLIGIIFMIDTVL